MSRALSRIRPGILIVVLTVGLFAVPLAAEAQAPGKVPRVGYVFVRVSSTDQRVWDTARQGLRELGYVEGQNITLEVRWAEGRPGSNVTGLSLLNPEISGKRLELLKQCLPSISRVAALTNPDNPIHAVYWKETHTAAQTLGLQLQSIKTRAPEDFDEAFRAAARGRADALLAFDDALTIGYRARLIALAAKYRLPTMYGFREFPDAGGLLSYGPNLLDQYRRTATYVDRILKGARPADLPIEQPTKFELVINRRTAQALGLAIPPSVLARADQVIE